MIKILKKTAPKRLTKYWTVLVVIVALTVVLNLIAFSKEFCDWYTLTVYRVLNAVIGTLTGWIKIAVGEIMMYIGAAMLVMLVVLGIVRIILLKKKGYSSFYKAYSKTCLMTLIVVLFVYTTNWFIPIRGNVLQVKENARVSYTNEELEELRTLIVNRMNEIALEIPRDDKGHVIIDYTQSEIAELMAARADEFPKLKGHYSPAKEAICSPILDIMGIGGYNYIYTMEPQINRYVDSLYMPVVTCHELCHHKGYYYENEASFLSVVVLTESDNMLLEYCGYRELYGYVNNACVANYLAERTDDATLEADFDVVREVLDLDPAREYSHNVKAIWVYKYTHPQLSDRVIADISKAREEAEELHDAEVNAAVEEVISEPVTKISDKGWEVQSEILKENIYSGMLLMYLQYYFD